MYSFLGSINYNYKTFLLAKTNKTKKYPIILWHKATDFCYFEFYKCSIFSGIESAAFKFWIIYIERIHYSIILSILLQVLCTAIPFSLAMIACWVSAHSFSNLSLILKKSQKTFKIVACFILLRQIFISLLTFCYSGIISRLLFYVFNF